MIKLMKYLKKSAGYVVLIIALLFLQAYCDLSLPDYTSKIVNVGIQQSGIEDSVPEKIRKTSMDSLQLFMDDNDKDTVDSFYEEDGDLFVLKDDVTSGERYELNSIFGKPMIIVASFSSGGDEVNSMLTQMGIPEGTDPMQALAMMPQEARDAMAEKISEKVDSMQESIITQAGVSYVKSEYEAIGEDVDAIQMHYIKIAGVRMLGMALITMLCAICVVFLSSRVAAALGHDLRNAVYRKVITFSSKEYHKFSTASLITRCTNDIQQVQQVMTLVDKLNLVTREMLTGIPVIRAFSREKHEEERFEEANERLTKTNLFVNRCMTFMMPTMMLIMNGVSVLIIYSGAYAVDNGTMQVGNVMAFIQYAMQIIMSFLMITAMSIMLPRANVAALRINDVLKTKVSVTDPENPVLPAQDVKGTVEFDHVSFAYPEAGENVLTDISFKAEKGETIAVIGSTGSGKSTLVNLIPRFYDVTKGRILVDGVDVRDMTQKDVRSRLGYVPQKGILFSGTIDSNIRYGKTDISVEEVKEAAEVAQATEFIDAKPETYDSPISQGGTNVSGGQKQRLSIARAIAKKPEIFIFDDSFSALDFKTDSTLRKALKAHTKDATTIIVAQRISTILNADKIIVLDDGHMAGIGTHKELMKNCEVYRQIAMSQLSEEELA